MLATATSRSLAQEVGPLRPDYAGPTGMQTIVQHALGAAGDPVHRACGCRCRSTSRVRRRRPRCGHCSPVSSSCTGSICVSKRSTHAPTRIATAVEEGLAPRPDVKAIVDRLDRDAPAPSGDELVGEIERFLRSQPEEHDRRTSARGTRPPTCECVIDGRRRSRMSVVRINAITVPKERADDLIDRFANRAGEVSKMPGFEAFELLAPTDDRDVVPRVHTLGDARADFDAWLESQAFQQGHKAHNTQGPVGSGSELWSFDVVQEERDRD